MPQLLEPLLQLTTVKDVVEMNQRLGGDKSLNSAAGDEGDEEKIDFLVDGRQNIEAKLADKQERELRAKLLKECVGQLKEREQYVVTHRMLSENPETLDDIGNKFGISRERVRQIEKKAFEHLSQMVKNKLGTFLNAAE